MKSILFFCGSLYGKSDKYAVLAAEIGKICASCGHRLVYGGGDRGIMGALAKAHLGAGGRVLGILPGFMRGWVEELPGAEYCYVSSMAERKMRMLSESDYALVLPGGIGTMDEFFEIATLVQLRQTNIGLGIVNQDSFFTHLVSQLDVMVKEGFLGSYDHLFDIFYDIDSLFDFLRKL
ncbi:TIGR00730 family Rossman fold protein [Spirochaetia bacterium 38H-sp]|uniref:Cytokinin riboside 5'-monophosphate phosphoribohydrolase n=1 Tax=Rarispira pelagica TaxID=3141764 RepID=A0ABU9UB50_9SPIR